MTTKKDFIELGEWQLNAFKQRDKYKQALEEIRDRLIVVTEEEPQSTINLVLDLKPIIEGVLNDRN